MMNRYTDVTIQQCNDEIKTPLYRYIITSVDHSIATSVNLHIGK